MPPLRLALIALLATGCMKKMEPPAPYPAESGWADE